MKISVKLFKSTNKSQFKGTLPGGYTYLPVHTGRFCHLSSAALTLKSIKFIVYNRDGRKRGVHLSFNIFINPLNRGLWRLTYPTFPNRELSVLAPTPNSAILFTPRRPWHDNERTWFFADIIGGNRLSLPFSLPQALPPKIRFLHNGIAHCRCSPAHCEDKKSSESSIILPEKKKTTFFLQWFSVNHNLLQSQCSVESVQTLKSILTYCHLLLEANLHMASPRLK